MADTPRPPRAALLALPLLLGGFAVGRLLFWARCASLCPEGLQRGFGVGADFIAFRAAGEMLSAEGPLAAYETEAFVARTEAIAGVAEPALLYHLPPTAYLLLGPLAALPHAAALWGLIVLSLALFVLTARAASVPTPVVLALLSSPPVLMAVQQGQLTVLTTALLASAALLAPSRPRAAGLCAALLVLKPQLGLLLPVFFLVRGYRQAFAWAALLTGALVAASLILYGAPAWDAFLAAAHRLQDDAVHGTIGYTPRAGMMSPFALILDAGLPLGAARVAQGAAVLVALLAVAGARTTRAPGAAALLLAATPLLSPYGYLYDLVPSALAAAILARDGLTAGWRLGERAVLMSVIAGSVLAFHALAHTPWPAAANLVLFALVVRRYGAVAGPLRVAVSAASSAWTKRERSAFEKGGAPGPT